MTVPQFDPYIAPEITDGDTYKPHEHIGATVIVKIADYKPSVVTANTPDGGPAVIVDLVDLDLGTIYRDVLWMGGAFVDGMKNLAPGQPGHTGRPLVIGIESRKSKSGRMYGAPLPATPAQIAKAGAYYQANGDPFAPQFATVPKDDNSTPPF